MNTTDIHMTGARTARAVRRLAAIAIVAGLALSFAAAFAALRAQPDVPGGGIAAWIADYITAVGDALGSG